MTCQELLQVVLVQVIFFQFQPEGIPIIRFCPLYTRRHVFCQGPEYRLHTFSENTEHPFDMNIIVSVPAKNIQGGLGERISGSIGRCKLPILHYFYSANFRINKNIFPCFFYIFSVVMIQHLTPIKTCIEIICSEHGFY